MIGTTVSHYKILEKLGEGGMGVVFKARDLTLDRFVALKFLPRELGADDDAKTRFIHEAKSASSLDHPNICTIHEIDETADGQTFIVMPCYEGESLTEKLREGPLDIDEAVDIMLQVASGLATAHNKGIVHRDIKPGNILLTDDGQVKLVDFGVAKLAGRTRVTRTGARVGTAGYMSPQQALGEELDASSDVFSLGVVLYELLAGRLPFRGEQEAALLYSIVHGDSQALSVFRKDVPETLQQIVEKALEKRPADRYANAGEFGGDLEAFAGGTAPGRPSRAWKRPRAGRFGRWMGRRGRVAAVVAAAAVVVLLSRPLWQGLFLSPTEALALAVVDFRDLATPEDPTTSAGMTGLVHVGLVESSPVRVISPEYLHDLRRRLFDTSRGPITPGQALEVARRSGATLLLSGQMGVAGSVSYVTWQLVDVASGESLGARRTEGDNLVLLADRIIADVLPLIAEEGGVEVPERQPSVSTLTTKSSEAYRRYVAGILAREEMRSWDAVRELQEAVKLDTAFALAFFELSRTQHVDLERETARDYAERAWELRTHLGIKDRMRLEAWRETVGGEDADAIATYREMLVRWPDDHKVLSDLSQILFYKWYFDDVVAVAGQGIALYTDDFMLGSHYGASLSYTGRAGDGLASTRTYAARLPENPNVWDELGLRYLAVGMPDSAEAAFRRALEIDPDFLWSEAGLGYCHYSRGDAGRAIEVLQQILNRGRLSPMDSLSLMTDVTFWPGLSLLYAESGRFAKAMEQFDAARRRVSVPESETQLEGRIHLMLRTGRAADAMRVIKTLVESTGMRFHLLAAQHYRIRALVALDSLGAARSALAQLRTSAEGGGASEPFLVLRAGADISLAAGDTDGALASLREMGRHGVPLGGLHDIERREGVAAAYRMKGRLQAAADELEALTRIYGSHAVARYELGQVYEELGRAQEARREYARFLEMWSNADGGLAQVDDARARLEILKRRSR